MRTVSRRPEPLSVSTAGRPAVIALALLLPAAIGPAKTVPDGLARRVPGAAEPEPFLHGGHLPAPRGQRLLRLPLRRGIRLRREGGSDRGPQGPDARRRLPRGLSPRPGARSWR